MSSQQPNHRARPRTRRRSLVAGGLLLAGVLLPGAVLAGCGDDSSSSSSASGDGATSTTGAATAKAPDKITIAYQLIPNGDLVVKHEKWLEKAFPDTEIEWKLFDSGGSVNEAVVGGSVDIGLAGSSPVSRGLSTPIDYQVPWIHDVIGKAEALVVKGDEGITSLRDLVGKKIATPFASTSHYSLLAALEDAGVDASTVDIIDAEPDDIYAAWSRGDIDGAYVWNPNLAKLVADGGNVLVDSEQLAKKGKTTYDLAVVTNDFAKRFPEAVTTWVAQQDRAVKLFRKDPDAFASDLAAELNIDKSDALAQAKDLIFLTADEQTGADYLGGGLAKNLIAAAKFNKAQGKIDAVQPDAAYEAAVTPTFAAKVG
ncbi:MAG: ABC transporter substrate-binding protein [Acidimicrobiales bacterium]